MVTEKNIQESPNDLLKTCVLKINTGFLMRKRQERENLCLRHPETGNGEALVAGSHQALLRCCVRL